MLKIVKYCKAEYNLRNGAPTLKLGTLNEFRTWETGAVADGIGDKEEGAGQVVVKNWDSANPDASHHKIDIGFPVGEGDRLVLHDLHIVNKPEDCFVFCCTLDNGKRGADEHLQMAKNLSPDYDSWYEIPDAHLFFQFLVAGIDRTFTIDHFDDDAKAKIATMTLAEVREISFEALHNPVIYVDSRTLEIDEDAIKPYAPSKHVQSFRRVMSKPIVPFAGQQEYRFAFRYFHPKYGRLGVNKPLLINTLPIGNAGGTKSVS